MLALALIMCRYIVTSKFGKVLIAIRDAESRTRFLGYKVESYKTLVFTLSACMAGIAGALYVPQVGIINPSEFAPANSIEEVIWVAVGGRGTLIGAVLGAVVVNYGKTYFTSGTMLHYWVFGIITLLALAGVVWVRRSALVGAIAGIVMMGVGFAIDLALPGVVMPYWSYAVLGTLIVVAMASSWNGYPLGAIFGALLVVFAVTPYEELPLAPYWLFALGGLFVGVTLLLPRGIIGTIQHYWNERRKPDAPGPDPQPVGEPMPAE
jgi:ABC-type branched-subunit amino acid transport system permease subunit